MASIRVGSRFGRLEVVGEGEPYVWRGRFAERRWACVCDCGNETEVRNDRLKAGATRSCGCLRVETVRDLRTTHNACPKDPRPPEYHAWRRLLRGAAPVVRRWRAKEGRGFAAFLADVGPRPTPGCRLARADPRRAHGPGNTRWAEGVPRRGVPRRFVVWRGRQVSLRDAAAAAGIPYNTLCKRLERGWPEREALRP